jgi:hypothetical protein
MSLVAKPIETDTLGREIPRQEGATVMLLGRVRHDCQGSLADLILPQLLQGWVLLSLSLPRMLIAPCGARDDFGKTTHFSYCWVLARRLPLLHGSVYGFRPEVRGWLRVAVSLWMVGLGVFLIRFGLTGRPVFEIR